MDLSNIIYERLQRAFLPMQLEVINDSARHKGHAGSRGGAGHYKIIIAANYFKDQSRLTAHREIYAVLADLIPDKIHALQITITHANNK